MNPFVQSEKTPLFQTVLELCRCIRNAGGHALLAGGSVRDALLGRASADYDLEVRGLTLAQLQKAVSAGWELDAVGMSFGILKIRHWNIDLSLPRRENRIGSGHRGFVVTTDPELSLEEAAARRDFTVNAMMADPLTGEIFDPWNGRKDLRKKILRHVSEHFAEDPLRVLRAMQFAARLNFTVAAETIHLCSRMQQEELPPERLAGEWEKLLLKGERPSKGLQFLLDSDWIRYYPELCELRKKGFWENTLTSLDNAVSLRTGETAHDLVLMPGVLCASFAEPEKEIPAFVNRLWRRNGLAAKVLAQVLNLGKIHDFAVLGAADGDYRRLSLAAGGLDMLARIHQARTPCPDARRHFVEKAKALGIFYAPPKPILLGRHLTAAGFPLKGAQMGQFLQKAFASQLDGAFSTQEEALVWLRNELH